jgi:hypothetical protein
MVGWDLSPEEDSGDEVSDMVVENLSDDNSCLDHEVPR